MRPADLYFACTAEIFGRNTRKKNTQPKKSPEMLLINPCFSQA